MKECQSLSTRHFVTFRPPLHVEGIREESRQKDSNSSACEILFLINLKIKTLNYVKRRFFG